MYRQINKIPKYKGASSNITDIGGNNKGPSRSTTDANARPVEWASKSAQKGQRGRNSDASNQDRSLIRVVSLAYVHCFVQKNAPFAIETDGLQDGNFTDHEEIG